MDEFLRRLAPVWQPHSGQTEFLESEAKIKVLACGRRWGKTDACAVQVLAALHRPFPTKHLLIAPTQDQARILFARLIELLEEWKLQETPPKKLEKLELRDFREGGPRLRIRRSPYPSLVYNGHKVSARSGHIGRSLRGNEATDIVVDEAAYVPESLITEIAMPMLATTKGSLTLISTPNGMNHFWRFFGMGQRQEHGIWTRHAPSSENPLVGQDFLEIQRQLISPRAFAVEYEAEFIEIEGTVFRKAAVESCLVPVLQPTDGDVFIGIDWGRHEDSTAVAVLKGTTACASLLEVQAFNQVGWTAQVARVAAIVARYPSAIIACDATGLGDGITEMLVKALPPRRVDEVVFTRKEKVSLIDNLSTLIEGAALRMEPDPRLLTELENFQYEANGKMEARGNYHDDIVTALALAASRLPKHYKAKVVLAGERSFTAPPCWSAGFSRPPSDITHNRAQPSNEEPAPRRIYAIELV